MSEASILAHLTDRLSLLKSSCRDLPERQKTLRQAVDWSFKLLEEQEAALMLRLSVFAPGFLLEDVDAVLGPPAPGTEDRLELLCALVRKSLLVRGGGDDNRAERYRMMETIRDYCRELLLRRDAPAPLFRRHAHYYLALAETAGLAPREGRPGAWTRNLDGAYKNIEAALA